MRLSQQTLSRSRFDDDRAVWRRPSIASASSGGGCGRLEQPLDAGLGAGRQVSQQLGARRAEAGAAVQVGDFAQVPGVVGRRLVAGPGGSVR